MARRTSPNFFVMPFLFNHSFVVAGASGFKNCNYKVIGIFYLIISYIAMFHGVGQSSLLRFELSGVGDIIYGSNMEFLYYFNMTMHGFVMIFFVVMPTLIGGFGNYLTLLYIAAVEIVYPKLNLTSLFLFGLAFVYNWLVGNIDLLPTIGGGWTMYPPLSTVLYGTQISEMWMLIISLLITGFSSLFSGMNFIITIFMLRSEGITFNVIVIFVFSILITSTLLILVLPILTGGLLMLLGDCSLGTKIFDWQSGGDSLLFQHYFWFFGHPEVYILAIPAFGIISHTLSIISQKEVFGHQSMNVAVACIGIFGSIVWAHHMYTSGLETDTKAYFTSMTLCIAIPTGIKIFNWVSTHMDLATENALEVAVLGFLVIFILGGLSGVVLANAIIDIMLHDTMYVVGHFHFILSIAVTIGIYAGLILFSAATGADRILGTGSTLVKVFLMQFLYDTVLTFLPHHYLGFNGMPRRILDYFEAFAGWNYISSVGSWMTIICVVVFFKTSYGNH